MGLEKASLIKCRLFSNIWTKCQPIWWVKIMQWTWWNGYYLFPLSLVLEEKNCSDPGGPLNGYRRVVEDTGLLNGRYAKIGTVIAFFCNNSYVLSGNEQRTCQDDGEWSGKQPICIKGSLQTF